jgi:hypothetical protein
MRESLPVCAGLIPENGATRGLITGRNTYNVLEILLNSCAAFQKTASMYSSSPLTPHTIPDNFGMKIEGPGEAMRHILALAVVIATATLARPADAEGTVSTHLRDGWDIKAVSQVSSTGRTQVILQKGAQGVVCTIYYSVTDGGWVGQGCDPLP